MKMSKMKTNFVVLLIFAFIYAIRAYFDIDELKSFNYGVDVRNEPIVMKAEDQDEMDVNTVHLTSKYGQPYQCSFPNSVEHEKQKVEEERVAMETGIPDLLKPMESAPCLRKTKDWWSYEFCPGKNIQQYHMSDEGKIEGEIILLGKFESEYNWDEDSDKSDTESKHNKVRRYHTQQYVNGTKCDLNGQQRKTEVRFVCEEGSADYIARLDEPETCVYIMTVHTMRICHHPYLKPPTPTKTVSITCNPLLTVIQYQEYLDQLEAKEEQERLKETERQREEEEQRKLKEEKAKYFQENNVEEEGDVEVEDDDFINPADLSLSAQDALNSDLSSLFKDVKTADGSPVKMKTMYKVVQSPEDIKDFLKETIEEMKKIQKKTDDEEAVEEEIEEEVEDSGEKISVPKITNPGKPFEFKPLTPSHIDDTDEQEEEDLDDPDLEELDTEIKTLKQRYRNRRDRLTDIKKKVKSSMEAQYESIIKEAKQELAKEEGLQSENDIIENRQAIRKLTKTLDSLLNKLDKTEEEIKAVDKELEQIAEYDDEEKDVKSIPPVKSDTHIINSKNKPKDVLLTDSEEDDNRVKVRVQRVRRGSSKLVGNDIRNKHTSEIEKSVQKELEKAGLGQGEKIQVKIITTAYDGDDETMRVLSDEESETFRNMIVDMIGGLSEVDVEQNKHDQQEENYSFVWNKNKQTESQSKIIPSSGTVSQEMDKTNREDKIDPDDTAYSDFVETDESSDSDDDIIKDTENL